MNLRGISIALLLCVCADAAWRLALLDLDDAPPRFVWTAPAAPLAPAAAAQLRCGDAPIVLEQGRLPKPLGAPAAHASTVVAFDARHPLGAQKTVAAFWFAGQRESAPDVGIAAATYDRQSQQWDEAQWVVTRDMLAAQLGVAVRRIGNPMAWRDVDGRVHLYVVATGLGGWAASRVVHLMESPRSEAASPNATLRFEAQRILPLMPLATWFNTSAMVRAQALPLQDGGALLPMYFELGVKYGLAVRVGPHGELRALRRMTERHDVLQPTLVATSPTEAMALMRNAGYSERVAWSVTRDAGMHWQDLPDATATNPDSSLAALRLPSGQWLVAHNRSQERRSVLWLSRVSDPSGEWQSSPLAKSDTGGEYSYPSLLMLGRDVWVTYTDQREAIAYARVRVRCEEAAP